ncbi:topoisomerase DNA-binding C4 zinc finger domain-containing protein [Ningiella sp. W23]|uniref:DNA topoisomerase family protein n=1 Tax=Ningiella sp. W23 TaxID=3023715 RepID=UPI003756542D
MTNQQQAIHGVCPECDSPLLLKHVGKSSFLACSSYPACHYTKALTHNDVSVVKEMPDSECPECNSILAVKKGRYGMFIACTNFPSCHFISNTHEVKKTAEYVPVDCPSCSKGKLEKRQNRFGKFFYACDRYPKCKFVANSLPFQQQCEQCGYKVMLQKGKASGVMVCADSGCGHIQDADQ